MSGRVPIPGVGAHARDRMAQRFGRDLTAAEWLATVAGIIDRKVALLCVMPNGSEHYLLEIGGASMRLVWVPDRASVVTVLPLAFGPTAHVRRAQAEPVRATLAICEKFRRGKRLARRTCWVPPEMRE